MDRVGNDSCVHPGPTLLCCSLAWASAPGTKLAAWAPGAGAGTAVAWAALCPRELNVCFPAAGVLGPVPGVLAGVEGFTTGLAAGVGNGVPARQRAM